jgi:HlyD family type I secretion membrane fusion protein
LRKRVIFLKNYIVVFLSKIYAKIKILKKHKKIIFFSNKVKFYYKHFKIQNFVDRVKIFCLVKIKQLEKDKKFIIFKRNCRFYYLHLKKYILLLIKPDPEHIADKPIKLGLIILGIFLGVFLIWGVLAPINSSSIANGKIVLDFNKKTIQHLEGGIIEKILVKEGQEVVTDEPLIYLRDIQTRSQTEMLSRQLVTSLAMEARLSAERLGLTKIDFSILQQKYASDPNLDFAKIIETQQNLFLIRNEAQNNKRDILHNRIMQINDEITGITAQKIAITKELKLLHRQYKMSNELVKNNNFPLNKLLDLEKQIAISEGKKGELVASIAKAQQSISETELEIINLKNENLTNIQAELQELEIKISDLTEQFTSTKDVLKRTIIKSPVSGIVTDLKYHTIGAVISPASEIMYVVPKDDEMIIEAQINPQDIDNVQKGLEAKIQLTAYKAKKVPKLLGKVLSVSADILTDEMTGEQYFLARIKISPGEIEKLKSDIELYPGMPVSVFVITGSRSLLQYLFSPISDAAYKAFREE